MAHKSRWHNLSDDPMRTAVLIEDRLSRSAKTFDWTLLLFVTTISIWG